jgi:hypothetical protein
MSHEDKELQAMLARFEVTPPSYLAQKIIANATAQPQQKGVMGFLLQAMHQWNYALAYKGMALACCMMLGVMLAQNQTNRLPKPASLDMSRLVVAQGEWME